MNVQEMVEKNKILEIRVGSHLYGTSTPSSDVDYSGVFIAEPSYYLGLKQINEVDLSIKSKNEDGKNNKDAVDRKFYEFRKFVNLCLENNPNIIEQVMVDFSNIIYINDIGRHLLDIKHLFPHKGLVPKYLGYSSSQKKKMTVKPNNFKELSDFKYWYEMGCCNPLTPIIYYKSQSILGDHIKYSNDFATIGDLNFNLNTKIKDVYDMVCYRINKATHRTEGYEQYGYDCKFAMHAVRLLQEGIELLETGELKFPLQNREDLCGIRNGNHTLKQVIDCIEYFENELKCAETRSHLPSKPRTTEVEQFVISTLTNYFKLI